MYLSTGILILAVAFVGYRYVQGQLEEVVGKSEALNDMVEQVLNKLSGKDAPEGFLERLFSVEEDVKQIHADADLALITINNIRTIAEKAASRYKNHADESLRVILGHQETITSTVSQVAELEIALKRWSAFQTSLHDLERSVLEYETTVRSTGTRIDNLKNRHNRLEQKYKLDEETLRAYRDELDDLLSSSRSLSSTMKWQSTCWQTIRETCYIFVSALPSEDYVFPEFYKYQLRVASQHDYTTVSLVQLSESQSRGKKPWRYFKLWFDDNKEKWYKVGIEGMDSGEYRFDFDRSESRGTDEEVTVEHLIEDMKAGNKLLVVPMSAESVLLKDRMFFPLRNFTNSYRMLEDNSNDSN